MSDNIILCGCGALGSHIAMDIADPNRAMTLYDDDRIEVINVSTGTTIYSDEHIGQMKARALSAILVRKYRSGIIHPIIKTVSKPPTPLVLSKSPVDLIIDCFDNIEARAHTVVAGVPTVHISIGEHGIGAIEWDDVFQLPSEGYPRGENPVCTNQLGRNLILFTSTIASIIINKYLSTGKRESAYVDVNSLEVYR